MVSTFPEVAVLVNDVPAGDAWIRALTEVRVQQRLSVPAQCELTFTVSDPGLLDFAVAPPGSALRVSLRGGGLLFNGQVTAVEYDYDASCGQVVRWRGYDLLHRLRKRQPVRAHVETSLIDLARALVADLGLKVEADTSSPTWQNLVQFRQSDFEILTETADRCGQYFAVWDGMLHFFTLRGTGDALPLVLGQSLLEARIELNGELACRTVTTQAWDPSRVELRRGQATSARSGRNVSASLPPGVLGGSGERTLSDACAQDDQQAEAMAQAELDQRVAREVTLWGVAEGEPRLHPGAKIVVRGVAAPCEGQYVVTSVAHRLDTEKGFVSEFSTAPPPRPQITPGALAIWGTVTRIDDPEGLGRVRVKLPSYGDVETDWMGVVAPGAGAGKGLLALPDVKDNVLVICANDDPTQGIVVGGLFGTTGPPDGGGIQRGAVRRYSFQTPGGQVVRLDDSKKAIRLENSDGSYVELTPGGARVHAAVDLTLEAPGNTVFIRGSSIRFQQA
jgi:phage protein D/phage baseplate assembly protein gpV